MEWFFYAFKKALKFEGRARRKEYGWFMLISFLIGLVGEILTYAFMILDMEVVVNVVSASYIVINFVIWVMFISVTSRRLHDLGYSGWWQLIFLLCTMVIATVLDFSGLLPFSGIAVEQFDMNIFSRAESSSLIVASLTYLIFMLWLLFKDGQRFENKFGPDPKAPEYKQ